ncbi:MAG: mycofactocin biosynthesis chaperone MftB [Acidimicrobiia bacterium]|nr:mycofactocin biosynthesis chaperone MftB [Acidimicrobiia bacterium]
MDGMEHRVVTLNPDVALRPEPFGALAYHYGNRRLVFLRHPDLVAVVYALDGHRTIAEVLDAEGIAPRRRASFVAALASMLDSEMLCERATRANHRDGAPLRSSGAVIGAPPVVPLSFVHTAEVHQ